MLNSENDTRSANKWLWKMGRMISRFITGDVSKKCMFSWMMPLAFFFAGSSFLIANLLFPQALDWRHIDLANLMDPAIAGGFILLLFGMGIAFFLLIPLPGYLYRHLKGISQGMSLIGTVFLALGVWGLMALGFLDLKPKFLHYEQNNALVTVGLFWFFIGGIFFGFTIFKDTLHRLHGKHQFNIKLLILGNVLIWFTFLGLFCTQMYLSFLLNNEVLVGSQVIVEGLPILASFAMWQNLVYLFTWIYFGPLLYIIPESVEPLELIREIKQVE